MHYAMLLSTEQNQARQLPDHHELPAAMKACGAGCTATAYRPARLQAGLRLPARRRPANSD
jgi:hypothetical protein